MQNVGAVDLSVCVCWCLLVCDLGILVTRLEGNGQSRRRRHIKMELDTLV